MTTKYYDRSNLKKVLQIPKIVKWEDLVGVLPDNVSQERVKLAYDFAKSVHKDQKRGTGEPYIHHPLAVAFIVAKLGLDEDTIVAALLHDTIEDSTIGVDKETIEHYFGKEVAFLVDGLTNFRETTDRFLGHGDSVEDVRKLLAVSMKDIRVLILRLSDKVHNSWTYKGVSKEKQERLARRALSIYAPLAYFAGLSMFKRELEESAFKILYPEEFDWMRSRLGYLYDVNMDKLLKRISSVLKSYGIKNFEVTGRRKSLWSTYQKILRYMKRDGKYEEIMKLPLDRRLYEFDKILDEIYDKLGILILVDNVKQVYKIVEIIKKEFGHLPQCFDDYVKQPKSSGYRAIHMITSVPIGEVASTKSSKGSQKLDKKKQSESIREVSQSNKEHGKHKVYVEVQIKTFSMHEYNEYGPASYFSYKYNFPNAEDLGWIQQMIKINRDEGGYRLSSFEEHVIVFTPQGEAIKIKKGATPVDLLFKIKKQVLFQLLKVVVNGKEVPFDYKLKTGDLVSFVIDPLDEFVVIDLEKYAAFDLTKEYLKKMKMMRPLYLEKIKPQEEGCC